MARLNELPEIVVDPNFFVPEGVVGIVVGEPATEKAPSEEDYREVIDDGYFAPVDTIGPLTDTVSGSTEILGVPTNITIVSQDVRVLPNGSALVDVVINIPDVRGATNYEVRITK